MMIEITQPLYFYVGSIYGGRNDRFIDYFHHLMLTLEINRWGPLVFVIESNASY